MVSYSSSVELERGGVVGLFPGILFRLGEVAVADGERVYLRSHEAAERVLGRADDRLAADVEARVDEDRAAGALLEARNQRVEARIGVGVNGLDARRVVDMGDGRT